GRPPICPCGVVRSWQGVVESPENSQQVSDWYSFSHLIHGMSFYGAARSLWRVPASARRVSSRWALPFAVSIEGSWESLENSPIIIDRYRSVTVSWGYSGDSVLNSASDIGFMALGFIVASRSPASATIGSAIAFDSFTSAMIRDTSTLNVLMPAWPTEATRHWQTAA
ncbi:hypothetical protein OY671_011107, partial [Metschnikowia pulcherrima]